MHKGRQVIVDYGCGEGLLTLAIARWHPDAKIYAVDPESEQRKKALYLLKSKKVEGRVRIVNRSIQTFKIPRGKPDILFFNFSLEHIAKKDDLSDDRYFRKYFSKALDTLEKDASVFIRLWPDHPASHTYYHGRWRQIDSPENVSVIKGILEGKGFDVFVDLVDMGVQKSLKLGALLKERQFDIYLPPVYDPFSFPLPVAFPLGKQYFVKIVARRGKHTKNKLKRIKKSAKVRKILKKYQ